MKKFKITLSIGFNSNRQEEITLEDLGYDDESWEELGENEQEEILDDYMEEWSHNFISLYYDEIQ